MCYTIVTQIPPCHNQRLFLKQERLRSFCNNNLVLAVATYFKLHAESKALERNSES